MLVGRYGLCVGRGGNVVSAPSGDIGSISLSVGTVNKSEETTVTVTVSLDGVADYDIPVNLIFSGGHSQFEDYGVGQHFTMASDNDTAILGFMAYNQSFVSMVMLAGETEVEATLTVENCPTLEMDRNIVISANGFGSKTLKIVDDNLPVVSGARNIIKVTDPNKNWDTGATVARGLTAAVGDDSTDNSDNLNGMTEWLRDNGGGVLYFPAGTYQFYNVKTYYPVTIEGEGRTVSILKRLDGFEQRGYPDWEFLLDTDTYNSASDSGIIAVTGVELHGNCTGGCFFDFTPASQTDITVNSWMQVRINETGEQYTFTFTSSPTGGLNIQVNNSNRAQMTTDFKDRLMANFVYSEINLQTVDSTSFMMKYLDGSGDGFSPYITIVRSTSPNLPQTAIATKTAEQSRLFSCTGANTANPGRTRFRFDDIYAGKNPPSGAILIPGQSDVKIYHMESHYAMSYGAIGYWGGNAKYEFVDIILHDDQNSIRMEHIYSGYGGSGRVWVTMDRLDVGHLGLGTYGSDGFDPESTIRVTSSIIRNYLHITNGDVLPTSPSNIVISDCTIAGRADGELWRPGLVTFNRCTFTASPLEENGSNNISGVEVRFEPVGYTSPVNQVVTFNDCTFNGTSKPSGFTGLLFGCHQIGNLYSEYNYRIVFNNCSFESSLERAVNSDNTGANWSFYGGSFDTTEYPLCFLGRSDTDQEASIILSNVVWGTNATKFAYIRGYTDPYYAGENIIRVQGLSITKGQNVVTSDYGWIGNVFKRVDGAGGVMRTIIGTGTPGSMPGLYNANGGGTGVATYDRYYNGSSWYRTTAMNTWAAE